ncbi:MAG: hypothetical protein ACRETD_13255, partial [Steroidobacteraceae bacterium]
MALAPSAEQDPATTPIPGLENWTLPLLRARAILAQPKQDLEQQGVVAQDKFMDAAMPTFLRDVLRQRTQ